MKRLALAFFLVVAGCATTPPAEQVVAVPQATPSQQAAAEAAPLPTTYPARPDDVDSIEHIVAALYDVISGGKGVARDWDRFHSLFHPSARMIPTGPRKEGGHAARLLTPDEYIERSGRFLVEQGFREREVGRRIEHFGHIAHVWSTYEGFREGEDLPFLRGINTIQLFNDGERWWVMSIMWEAESNSAPLPEKYLR